MQDFAINIGSRNEVLILNEYNGEISIISGYEGRDGKNYFNMVFPRDNKTKEPRPTAIPQKVRIGDKTNAASILRQFADYLSKPEPSKKDPVDDNPDSIPF